MTVAVEQIVSFYANHPISADAILTKIRNKQSIPLHPGDLQLHDQDHYGGTDANDELARHAQITPGSRIADFCAGIGGPARYLAHRYGADVVALELTPLRVRDGAYLTDIVGLSQRVHFVRADVRSVPLRNSCVDIVISQEAFLYIEDKGQVLREAHRVLRCGGRLAFTDWVSHDAIPDEHAKIMWAAVPLRTLEPLNNYLKAIETAGFQVARIDDLADKWGQELSARLTRHRQHPENPHPTQFPNDRIFEQTLQGLIDLVRGHTAGGVRIVAEKQS